jgi:F-type H+-transporting ATPase subunit gamma
MKREQEIERRLRAIEGLSEAITAMKSLSAHRFREARAALAPAHTYRAGIDALIEKTGAWLPAGVGGAGLLVIGGDLGLCGGYNRDQVAAAYEHRNELGAGPTFCVGRRAQALLMRHGVVVERGYAAPTSTDGITDLLLVLAQDILKRYVTENLSSFDVVASRFEGVGTYQPAATRLLPVISERQDSTAASRYVSADTLAAVAVRELLYITIHGLLLDALATEHGARLAATQAAEDWRGRLIEKLKRHLASARREASTQEVIEIAAGARARHRRA